jgi:chitin-binding protein
MPAVTRSSALAAAGLLTTLAALVPALPAIAHGAPTEPISRTAACGARGSETDSAACRAARKANGGPIGNFDNLRIPNVNGRDREVVPDGKLCSGGLDDYAGLDLARADWPATKATAGDTLDLRYATTIPHRGTFRVYLTDDGYDPGEPLRWDDLAGKPLLVDEDPPLRDGAYRMRVRLPENRTGRHLLYVIWQNSSTPDTYYSCSDLQLAARPAAKAAPVVKPKPAAEPAAEPAAGPAPERTTAAPEEPAAPVLDPVASVGKDTGQGGYLVPGALAALAVLAVPLVVLVLRRGRRSQRIPRTRENR